MLLLIVCLLLLPLFVGNFFMLCGTLSFKFCNHLSWEERANCFPLFASWCYAAGGVTCLFLAVPTEVCSV